MGLFLFAGSVWAGGGGVIDSGGGSGLAAEFADLGYAAAATVDSIPQFPANSVQLLSTIKSTMVEFTHDLLTDPQGNAVDALNFPSQQHIKVNIERWQLLGEGSSSRTQLVVHEYLGILQIDDHGYIWSHQIVDTFVSQVQVLQSGTWTMEYIVGEDNVPATLIRDFSTPGRMTITNICHFSKIFPQYPDAEVSISGEIKFTNDMITYVTGGFNKVRTPDHAKNCGVTMTVGQSRNYHVISKTQIMYMGQVLDLVPKK